jgi:hypothetical protein
LSAERGYVRHLVAEAVPRLLVGGIVTRDDRSVLGAANSAVSLLGTGVALVAGAAMGGGRQSTPRRRGRR